MSRSAAQSDVWSVEYVIDRRGEEMRRSATLQPLERTALLDIDDVADSVHGTLHVLATPEGELELRDSARKEVIRSRSPGSHCWQPPAGQANRTRVSH